MEFDQAIEKEIDLIALDYMKQSRPDWNVPHLYTAVFYMKKLINNEGGDPKILLPAIYLHDIGYAGMLSKGYSFEDNKKVKSDHMRIGAELSKEILRKIGSFSEDEIDQISVLISVHDNLEEINNHNRQLVFEADSLAQIDTDRVKPNFDKKNFLEFLDDFNKRRASLFKTKTGRDCLHVLLPKATTYFN